MDQELVDYLNRRFAENEETTGRTVEESARKLGGEMDRRFAESDETTRRTVEESARQTQVMVEHLRGHLERVAESVVDMGARSIDIGRRTRERGGRTAPSRPPSSETSRAGWTTTTIGSKISTHA